MFTHSRKHQELSGCPFAPAPFSSLEAPLRTSEFLSSTCISRKYDHRKVNRAIILDKIYHDACLLNETSFCPVYACLHVCMCVFVCVIFESSVHVQTVWLFYSTAISGGPMRCLRSLSAAFPSPSGG